MSILRQGDPAWGATRLGYGPATIAEAGCLLTALAQVARHYGLSTNPLDLNQRLMGANRYVQGDLLADDALNGIIPSVRFVTKWDFSNRPADLSVLTNTAEDEYVIELDFDHNPNDGIQTHFVRFVSWDGTTLVIDDPEFGTEDNFTKHYGNDLKTTILKIVKYNGPAQAAPAVVAPTSIVATPLVANLHAAPAGARVHVAPDVNAALAVNNSIPNGLLNGGQQFNVISYQRGADGFIWYSTIHHNYVRSDATLEGVSILPVGSGGTTNILDPAPTGQAEGDVAVTKSNTPEEPVMEVKRTLLLDNDGKPATALLEVKVNEEVHAKHDIHGSLVWDLSQHPVEPKEIVPAGNVLPFVAFLNIDGKNYFQTQHIIDEGLDIGIDGADLKYPATTADPNPTTETLVAPKLNKAVSFLDKLSGNKDKGGI